MDNNDAQKMACIDCALGISEPDVKQCFGLSKMTVYDEGRYGANYTKMLFVEFLEFIGRLAHSKFKYDPTKALCSKIEDLLDELLPNHWLNLTRNDVDVQVEEISESDEDY
jgi:hypothetical protein